MHTDPRETSLVSGTKEDYIPADMQELDHLRAELVRFGKYLHDKNFVSGCDGNLSVRLDADRVLTTPTSVSKGMMFAEDMVIVDMQGRRLEGSRNPSSELLMHLTIYRARPDVNAVVHAHPPVATGFACAGMALDQPICSEIVVTLGSVPLAPYATTGTQALSDAILPLIPDYDAVLLANHGAVAYGKDLMAAYMRMETIEHYANILLTSMRLGQANHLSQKDIESLVSARRRYEGSRTQATLPVKVGPSAAAPGKEAGTHRTGKGRGARAGLKVMSVLAAVGGPLLPKAMAMLPRFRSHR